MTTRLNGMNVIYNGNTYPSGSTITLDNSKRNISVQYELITDSNPKCGTIIIRIAGQNVWSNYYSTTPSPNRSWTHTESFQLTNDQIRWFENTPRIEVLFIDEDGNSNSLYVNVQKESSTNEPSTDELKEIFRDSMVETYSNSSLTVGWYNNQSPILDVTNTVRQVEPNIESARLTIRGDLINSMVIDGPYDSEPNPRSTQDIVSGWENDRVEWERMSYNGKYYWVAFRCSLEKTYPTTTPTSPPTTPPTPPTSPTTPTPPTSPTTPTTPPVKDKLQMKIKLTKKPFFRSVLIVINGSDINTSKILSNIGQEENVDITSGEKYNIITKKSFSLFGKQQQITAKSGQKTTITASNYIIDIEII